jgi:hypothetical protein
MKHQRPLIRDMGEANLIHPAGISLLPIWMIAQCCRFANIKFGGGITAMSGSIGGQTFARNRFGYYSRPRTKPVNPNSSLQSAIRLYMKYYSERWHDTLNSTQRGAWASYAAAVATKNRLGESVYLTGYNWYIAVNIVRAQAQNSKCDNGPAHLTLVESDPGFLISASAATQLLSVTWTKGLPWTEIAASIMCIFQGQPQVATRNFFNGPWKYAGLINGNCPDTPKTIAASYTLVQGQKIWIYGRISTGPLDARLSAPMIASCVVGA